MTIPQQESFAATEDSCKHKKKELMISKRNFIESNQEEIFQFKEEES